MTSHCLAVSLGLISRFEKRKSIGLRCRFFKNIEKERSFYILLGFWFLFIDVSLGHLNLCVITTSQYVKE